MAGDLNNNHDKVMKMLLVLDSLRGEDSTGVAFVRKHVDGETAVAKALGDPFNLFNDSKFCNNMHRINRVFMGHNRYATVGGVAKSSAHPFDFDTLVGVHNGTLTDKARLEDHMDFKVDSQALYHGFEKNGVQATINRLSGRGNAWSLVWWNKVEQTINFLRNAERPLYMCRSEDGKVLFWASEPWMLHVSLSRNHIKHGEVFQTEEDIHYSVEVKKGGELCKPRLVRAAAPVYMAPVVAKPAHIERAATNVHALPSAHPATAVTPATSKGVVDQKKPSEVTGKETGSVCDPSYIDAKTVRTFEILASHTDSHGAKYLTLFDPKRPYVDIRLYPRKLDAVFFEHVGEDITGCIGSYDLTDRKAIRGYYKVSPDTAFLKNAEISNPVREAIQKELDEAFALAPDEPEETFMNHRGHLVSESEWKRTYGNCEWCNDPLNPLDRNRFTTGGQCICSQCVKDPELTEFVNLV